METAAHDPAISHPESHERVKPRLLNMRQAADYLGCSFWTARDYILQGLIPIVDMPPLRAREGDRQRKMGKSSARHAVLPRRRHVSRNLPMGA